MGKEGLKKTTGDHVHTAVRATISALPLVGGPGVEIFGALIGPPIEKRRDKWIQQISDDLIELSGRVDGIIPLLSENEEFISIILSASYIAVKTHNEEKLLSLRNIVLGFAENADRDADKIFTFIQLIDKLTPSHLIVLKFFNNPPQYITAKGKSPRSYFSIGEALRYAIPEIANDNIFLQKILLDLDNENLTKQISQSLNTTMTSQGVLTSRTTELGKLFLGYIENSI